jgi:hypothetical protein
MTAHALIGTWALVASEWRRVDGKHANPFGAGSVGVLTYDAGGYMSAQIMRADRPPGPVTAPTIDAAFAAAVPGYLAYFGTYEIDEVRGVVTHTVTASSFPPWTGGQHHRRFVIDGDQLTLSDDLVTADGVAVAASTTWRRVT